MILPDCDASISPMCTADRRMSSRSGNPRHRSRRRSHIEIDGRASQRQRIYALQTGAGSPIPACPANASHAVFTTQAPSADGPNTFETKGRDVDGGLARLDADRGRRGPRGNARTERVSDHGAALDARPTDVVPVDPPVWRVRGDEDG